jgi:hypothetical protein
MGDRHELYSRVALTDVKKMEAIVNIAKCKPQSAISFADLVR